MKTENKHNKDLGFQVPQDFFKNFEEEMMTQVNLDEKLGKETGFEVPDGYFESLEKQLLPVEDSKVKSLPRKKSVTRYLYPVLAVAAVLAVIFTLETNEEVITLASVETTELEEYIASEASLYDDTTIDILFADNNILEDISFSDGIATDELYDYLQDDIDLNEIITE